MQSQANKDLGETRNLVEDLRSQLLEAEDEIVRISKKLDTEQGRHQETRKKLAEAMTELGESESRYKLL
jgi:predicted  nucleic acid-binding Zn-ribbon protein